MKYYFIGKYLIEFLGICAGTFAEHFAMDKLMNRKRDEKQI